MTEEEFKAACESAISGARFEDGIMAPDYRFCYGENNQVVACLDRSTGKADTLHIDRFGVHSWSQDETGDVETFRSRLLRGLYTE